MAESSPVRRPVPNEICIGLDQSYTDTGVAVVRKGKLMAATDIPLFSMVRRGKHANTRKRNLFRKRLTEILEKVLARKSETERLIVLFERTRLFSGGHVSPDYIYETGALNSIIVDTCFLYGLKSFSVDTKVWKKGFCGTSKPEENPYGADPKKWPVIKKCIELGYENKILTEAPAKKRKGVFVREGIRMMYNDNIADSIGIAFYGQQPYANIREET